MHKAYSEGRFIYKNAAGADLAFYLIQPRVRKYEKAPLIMHNIGGGWTHYEITDNPVLGYAMQEKLLDEGFAIMATGHRGGDCGGQMGEILSDLCDALVYVHAHNDAFSVDLQRIIPIGHSAGGHVSLMLAMAPGELIREYCINSSDGFDYRCIGCISLAGPTILYPDPQSGELLFPFQHTERITITHIFGGKDHTDPVYQTYSPLCHVHGKVPPIGLVYGVLDDIVSVKQGEMLYSALCDAGIRAELIRVQGGGHLLIPEEGDMMPSREEIEIRLNEFCRSLL